MADCLTLLRQYNIQKKEIVERDELIIFEQIAWPRNAKTNYLVYRSGQGGAQKEYYTLESLLFLLKNVSLSHPMYVQRAGAQNIPVIKFPDRRGLLAYLNGEVDSSHSIDKSIHLEMGIAAPPPKRANEEGHGEGVKKPRMESEDILADKQRLVEKLEARKEGGAITDQIRSLSEAMSVEKIAAIKAKRLAKKRATIKTDNDMGAGVDRMFLDDATKDIMSKERLHRTRTTVLQSSGKSFSNIFSLLQSVKARDEGKGEMAAKQPAVVEEPRHTRNPPPPPTGYSRYDQERFRGKEETGDFKIDTTGTYHGMNLKSVTEGVSKPLPQIQPVKAPPAQKPNDTVKKEAVGVPNRKDNRLRTPIIIVPASPTAVITMYNVKDFLEGVNYISPEEKKRAGGKRQNEIILHRKRPHPTQTGQSISIPYRVTDNPLRLSPQEWKQVVAVFVAGPTWQFKGWPGLSSDGSPVNIFSKIKGFHVKFEESRLDPNIKKWDVQILQISKTKRHLDKASILCFWETLDKFVVKHCPNLRY